MKIALESPTLGLHMGADDDYHLVDGRLELDVDPAELERIVGIIDRNPSVQVDILGPDGAVLFYETSAGRPRLPGIRGWAPPAASKSTTRMI